MLLQQLQKYENPEIVRDVLRRMLEQDFLGFVDYFFKVQNSLKFKLNDHHEQVVEIINIEDGNVTARFFGDKTITGNSIDAFMPYLNRTYVVIKNWKVIGHNVPNEILADLNTALNY